MTITLQKDWWRKYKTDVYYVVCIIIAGTLLHFAYEWSGENAFVAIFSPISESVWEHLKLLFVPAFFFTIFMYYLLGDRYPEYLWYQTKSIFAGMLFILLIYYTYSGITQRENMWADIGIFYLAAVFAGITAGRCRNRKDRERFPYAKYSAVILLLLWAVFIWLTFQMPQFLAESFPGLFCE